MKRLLVVLTVLAFSTPAFAGDIATGKVKAVPCMTCHGEVGISPNDLWPNLAGQKEGYLIKQIKAFRDDHPMIGRFMKPISDADVEAIAAYFNSFK